MNLKISRQIEQSIFDATSAAVRDVMARCKTVETTCGTDAFRATIAEMVREAVAASMAEYAKSVDARIAAADVRIEAHADEAVKRTDAAFGRIGDIESRPTTIEAHIAARVAAECPAVVEQTVPADATPADEAERAGQQG